MLKERKMRERLEEEVVLQVNPQKESYREVLE